MLLRRGEPSPYDSGVVIEINTYRKIRRVSLAFDSLLITSAQERQTQIEKDKERDEREKVKDAIILRQADTIIAKDNTIAQVNQAASDAIKRARKLSITPNPVLDFTIKVGAGILIGFIVSDALTR